MLQNRVASEEQITRNRERCRKRPLSPTQCLRDEYLKKQCSDDAVVDRATVTVLDILSKDLDELSDPQKDCLYSYFQEVYVAMDALKTSKSDRLRQERDRQMQEQRLARAAGVKKMLGDLPPIQQNILVETLLPANLLDYSHEVWKAKHSEGLKRLIDRCTNEENKKLLQAAYEILMESAMDTESLVDDTTHTMDIKASTVDFKFKDESEFNPTKSIYLRDEYTEIWLELHESSRNVVVVGDPGIGKSTLLRFVFGCFVFGWKYNEETKKWKSNVADAVSVFKVMESGQYVYYDKASGTQHQGIMGRREPYEDKWRKIGVWLLIDGKVNDEFLCKTTKACVFSSPEKKNFHTLLKSSNAIRIVLSPWSREELNAFLSNNDTMKQLHSRMEPYLKGLAKEMKEHMNSEVSDEDEPMSDASSVIDSTGENVPMPDASSVIDSTEDNASMPDASSVVENTGNDESNIVQTNLPVDVFSYDELSEWAAIQNKGEEAELAFLKDHFWRRFDLVGGRIRLIVNPSITFATLKLDVKKAMNCISVEHLEKVGSLDLLSYVPSIVYSLVPGNCFSEFYRIDFATDAIRWIMVALLTQSKRNDLVRFLKECDKFNVASSLLGAVYEGVMHIALSSGGEFKVKRLIEPPKPAKNTKSGKKKKSVAAVAPDMLKTGEAVKFDSAHMKIEDLISQKTM